MSGTGYSGLFASLITLIADVILNPRDDVQLAKDVLRVFIASGFDAGILMGYLTDADQKNADANTDLKEEAKLAIEAASPGDH